jgi:hypothetical protein
MGAGLPADMRRAQSGQVLVLGRPARRDKVLDAVSAVNDGHHLDQKPQGFWDQVYALVNFFDCPILLKRQ